jgi:uncharacterized protein (DUF58 family)
MLADYPELVTLGLTCVAALLAAAMWMVAKPRLTATREIRPQRVTETESAYGTLVVKNEGRHRSPPSVVTENVADHSVAVPVPSLAARSAFRTVYPLPAGRRGRYAVPAPVISHSDPLQLLRTERSHGGGTTLYVHPRIHDVVPMPAGGRRDLEGPAPNNAPPEGVAFHSLREYVPGDDRRHIHWKSSARTGTLMVRHTAVPEEARHLVILDTSAKPYAGSAFEGAVRAAASLCVAASRAGFPVDLRTTGTGQAGRPADTGITASLDLLATTQTSSAMWSSPARRSFSAWSPERRNRSCSTYSSRQDHGSSPSASSASDAEDRNSRPHCPASSRSAPSPAPSSRSGGTGWRNREPHPVGRTRLLRGGGARREPALPAFLRHR